MTCYIFECSHWWKMYFTSISLQSECCNFDFNQWEHSIYKVCIIQLDHIFFEKIFVNWQLFDNFAACAQNTTLILKVWRRFFQILWPSQKTQTLAGHVIYNPAYTNSNWKPPCWSVMVFRWVWWATTKGVRTSIRVFFKSPVNKSPLL